MSKSICSRTGDDAQVKGPGFKAGTQRKREKADGCKERVLEWLAFVNIAKFRDTSPSATCHERAGAKENRHLTSSGLSRRRQPPVGQFCTASNINLQHSD